MSKAVKLKNSIFLSSESIIHKRGGGWQYLTNILDNIYPIGSIFISTVKTNPSEYFGGEWEQIKDRFLLACGSTYSNGSTGGEATHVLTELEMPKHWHKTVINFGGNETLDGYSSYSYQSGSRYYNNTSSAGGSQPHNNMPPYLAVYIWKRIS